MLDSFILKWWGTTAADLNLHYISSNSTFLVCYDFSLLLRSTSSITRGTSYESHGIIQRLQYCTKYRKIQELKEIIFFTAIPIYWRDELLAWR